MNDQERLPETQANPVGKIGAVLSVIGLVIVVGALICVLLLNSQYQADREYQPGDLRPVTDTIGNAFTFLEQLVLFVVGGLVGGTLSLVGFIVSAVGLKYADRRSAQIGLFAGLAALLLLGAFVALKLNSIDASAFNDQSPANNSIAEQLMVCSNRR